MAEQEAVNATESAPVEATQEVVNTPDTATEQGQETEQQAVEEKQEPTQSSSVASHPTVEALDEFGVPYKNRFAEYRRKYEEMEQKVNQLSQRDVHQPQYTEEQLRTFATQTDNPAYAQWALSEVDKIKEQKIAKTIRTEIDSWKTEQQNEIKKQQAFQYVLTNFPDAFVKDQKGNLTGQWNINNPIVKEIGVIMQDPRIAKEPDALAIASDIAYARVMRQASPIINQQLQNQKAAVKNLQKKTLVEGGGQAPVAAKPAHRVAIEKAKQTGSLKDVAAAFTAMDKARKTSTEK